MTDTEKILWTFIGIGFGWTLNQASQWFRARAEDKKLLKQVLFDLLEMHYQCNKIDFSKVLAAITEVIFKKFPKEQQTEEIKTQILTTYTTILETTLRPVIIEELKQMENNYQESVKNLAKIDPIKSFFLSGKTSIVSKIELYLDNTFVELKNAFPNEKVETETDTNIVFTKIKKNIHSETLTEIEFDARKIAWTISPILWLRTLRVFSKLKKKANASLDNEIEDLIDKLGLNL